MQQTPCLCQEVGRALQNEHCIFHTAQHLLNSGVLHDNADRLLTPADMDIVR